MKWTKGDKTLERVIYLRNIEGRPKLAMRLAEKYLFSLPSKERSANLCLLLANLYIDVGETKKALRTFRIASEKAKTSKNLLTLADILRKWGYLYLHTGNRNQAIRKIKESVAAIEKILKKDNKNRETLAVAASCYASLGNYFGDIGNLKRAHIAYKKSLAFAKKSGFKERTVTVLGDLANLTIQEKRWDEARDLLIKTRDKARKYYQHAFPAALLRLGRFFMNPKNPRKDLVKAEKYLKESLEVARKGSWKREQADALLWLGNLAVAQGKPGTTFRRKAEALYRGLGYRSHIGRK